MLRASAPLRVSLLGGGTDYPEWFERERGLTVGAAIRYYTEVEVLPPGIGVDHPLARRCASALGVPADFSLRCRSDLPPGSGLGSSSSLTVAVLRALSGEAVDPIRLAELAVVAEGGGRGVQDQYACAIGGLLELRMGRGRVRPRAVRVTHARRRELERHLLLVHTGTTRRHTSGVAALVASGRVDAELRDLAALAERWLAALAGGGGLPALGELVEESWRIKRGMSAPCPEADAVHDAGVAAGASGGKLLGAGGGGFVLLLVEPARRPAVAEALSSYVQVPVTFDTEGARLL